MNCRGADVGLKERGRVGDQWHRGVFHLVRRIPGAVDYGQQIGCGQMLRSQDSIEGIERKLAPAVQKVGEMGLPKPGLARKQRDAKRSALYPTQQLQA
jgi:hypothetical protein